MNVIAATATPFATTLLRILYADDLLELRDVVRLSLARLGHDVLCVADGSQALASVKPDPQGFDLIITDHHMPVMNGLDFVKALPTTSYAGRLIVFAPNSTRRWPPLTENSARIVCSTSPSCHRCCGK